MQWQSLLTNPEPLQQVCREITPADGMDALEVRIKKVLPDLGVRWMLTRGHWHRLGGVVDGNLQRISDSITQWAEEQAHGDVDELIAGYQDAGYYATQLAGRTHYLTAPVEQQAEHFLQIEIEELQEIATRPLVAPDWYPDSVEEFIEPIDAPRIEPKPIAPPYYQFRRITAVNHLLHHAADSNRQLRDVRRFFHDWNESSASRESHFCRHWVLELREYMDQDGEKRISAKPISTFAEPLPPIPSVENLKGAELANAIHGYDRKLGFSFAWYFILLTRKAANDLTDNTAQSGVIRRVLNVYFSRNHFYPIVAA